MPGAPSSVLATRSNALVTSSDALVTIIQYIQHLKAPGIVGRVASMPRCRCPSAFQRLSGEARTFMLITSLLEGGVPVTPAIGVREAVGERPSRHVFLRARGMPMSERKCCQCRMKGGCGVPIEL